MPGSGEQLACLPAEWVRIRPSVRYQFINTCSCVRRAANHIRVQAQIKRGRRAGVQPQASSTGTGPPLRTSHSTRSAHLCSRTAPLRCGVKLQHKQSSRMRVLRAAVQAKAMLQAASQPALGTLALGKKCPYSRHFIQAGSTLPCCTQACCTQACWCPLGPKSLPSSRFRSQSASSSPEHHKSNNTQTANTQLTVEGRTNPMRPNSCNFGRRWHGLCKSAALLQES